MIPVIRLHYKLDLKLNRLASNEHQQIPEEDKDFALYEAAIKLMKRKADPDKAYGSGLDSFRRRYQDLESFIVPHEEVALQKVKSPITIYSYSLSELENKFFLPVDIYTLCDRGQCKDRMVVVEKIAKHSDVPVYLQSTDYQPSFAYQATFATINSGDLMIYAEDKDGVFKPTKAYISYLRYPAKMCIGGYEDLDGVLQDKVDCDLPEHLEDELLDIAVEDLALSIENQAAAQASQIRAKKS